MRNTNSHNLRSPFLSLWKHAGWGRGLYRGRITNSWKDGNHEHAGINASEAYEQPKQLPVAPLKPNALLQQKRILHPVLPRMHAFGLGGYFLKRKKKTKKRIAALS